MMHLILTGRNQTTRALSAVLILVVIAASSVARGQAGAEQKPAASGFEAKFGTGAIVSLKATHDLRRTEFVQPGKRLGDVLLRYRQENEPWHLLDTAGLARSEKGTFSGSSDGTSYRAGYHVSESASSLLDIEIRIDLGANELRWTLAIRNRSNRPLEIGDLAIPLPMSRSHSQPSGAILKHGLVSGHGSFFFWIPSDSKGPFLTLTPSDGTSFEYWDAQNRNYSVYIHSKAAGEIAAKHGTHWRQPHTSRVLAPLGQPGDAQSYGFKLRWADDYEAVRRILVEEEQIDVHVAPGMTVPLNLAARFDLRTRQPIIAVDSEFPEETRIESIGQSGEDHIYQDRFSKLGENRLTVRYGNGRHMFLEFFCTQPIETLIKKRGAFLARSQHKDPSKWYDGLITDWNMESQTLLSPDHYDPIPRARVYAVTCDDPGLGKPAFLAAKNAEFPVQTEVEALDYYIAHFVWGCLQRRTDESYPYGIYGIPEWKTNRQSSDPGRDGKLHLWRIYDYPHLIAMYFGMYRIAKNHPEIKTALPAKEYLQRAFGTALAMFTIPNSIWSDWSPYGTGYYNEVVIPDLIDELQAAGMTDQATLLRGHWERKVKLFIGGRLDLFRSEYAFDSTGFESTHALAKYALQHSENAASGISSAGAHRFMENQLAANIFCRGWLEPAYYYLGSDYRGSGGNAYTLTYMSQMGGWGVLDYALNFARDPYPCLRLGYASYLSAWALMNTGTAESNYGYWYPGQANDGGAGGGFEPAPFGRTWLGQPHHRGAWYYACEIDLGFCGALRTAATVLADDPIFGRVCYGGDWRKTDSGIEVIPKDGLRRRFHAVLQGGRLHMTLDADRFAASDPIVIREDCTEVRFALESNNRKAHIAKLALSGVVTGEYTVSSNSGILVTTSVKDGLESILPVPISEGTWPKALILRKVR
jgi:hypothetical protein